MAAPARASIRCPNPINEEDEANFRESDINETPEMLPRPHVANAAPVHHAALHVPPTPGPGVNKTLRTINMLASPMRLRQKDGLANGNSSGGKGKKDYFNAVLHGSAVIKNGIATVAKKEPPMQSAAGRTVYATQPRTLESGGSPAVHTNSSTLGRPQSSMHKPGPAQPLHTVLQAKVDMSTTVYNKADAAEERKRPSSIMDRFSRTQYPTGKNAGDGCCEFMKVVRNPVFLQPKKPGKHNHKLEAIRVELGGHL